MSRRREGRGERSSLSDSQHALLQRMRVSRRLIGKAGAGSSTHVRREQLMLAAARVLTEKGYEGASLREICAAAGILPGSLYYHFKSKEDLFVSLHAEGFRQLNEAVDTAIARESDPWARLEAACAAHLTLLVGAEYESLVGGTSLFHPARSPLQRRLNRDRDAYEERFRQDDRRAPAAARRRPDPAAPQPARRAQLDPQLVPSGRKSPRELAHQLVQKILRRSLDAPGRRAEPRKIALS